MPNFVNDLRECLGFSHTIISTFFNVSFARMLISSKLPIGVATMYKPGLILILLYLIIFLTSCAPAIYTESEETDKTLDTREKNISILEKPVIQKKEKTETLTHYTNEPLINEISIILPRGKKEKITSQFINVIELAVYEKQLKNISFSIDLFEDSTNLEEIIETNTKPGKIFIGPTDSLETKLLNKYCKKGNYSSSSCCIITVFCYF